MSRKECLTLGLTDREVDRLIDAAILVPSHDGVYRHAAAPDTWHGRERAAVLAGGTHAFASHHGMARLYRLRGVWSDVPEITVLGTRKPILRGVRVHRIDRLDPPDTHVVDGIQCLAPPVALLTLGARANQRQVTNAVHDAVTLGLTTKPRLQEARVRLGGRGRRGTAKFRVAIDSLPTSGGAAATGLELDLYQMLVGAGFPPAELQHPVLGADGIRRLLDIALVDARLDIEADGDRWHKSDEDVHRDAIRDAALKGVNWEVKRFEEARIRARDPSIPVEAMALYAARLRQARVL